MNSHDCIIFELNGKKVKSTYEAYNGNERFSVTVFDGFKFNHVLSMADLGEEANTKIYVQDDDVRLDRAELLFTKSEKVLSKLLSE